MRNIATRLLVALTLIFSAALTLQAQDTASLTGVVSDASGAVVPGVSVLLVDTKSSFTYQVVTNALGSYTISAIKPAQFYKISFIRDGFQSVVVSNLALSVGTTRTQNARLVPGQATTLEISASAQAVTIDTVDATIGNNINVRVLDQLPIQNRSSPAVLFTLQPGVGAGGAITGARTDQTTVTVDSLDVNDVATGQFGAIISAAPVDSVEEFKGTVAGQLSSNGPGGGGQFQLITKSGTNSFHGDLNEYHRDTSTVANEWFNNNAGVPRPPLIRNQFGGAIGGPILKDKLFFFFDFDDSRIIRSASISSTVPLDSYRNGNIGYILKTATSGGACSFTSRRNTTPQCIGTLTPAQAAALDPKHIGISPTLSTFINQRYPHVNDLTGGDGINTGSFRFTTPTPSFETIYVGKLDYKLSNTMRAFARVSIDRADATQSPIRFPGDPVTNPFVDRSYSYVFGHVWTIGSNKVNQFIVGDTITKYNFATTYNPLGTTLLTLGPLGSPYNAQSSQKRRVPVPEIRDDFNWTKGAHNLSFGGTFKFIKTNSQLVNDFNFVGVGLGGNTNQLDASLRPADIRGGSTAPSLFDSAFTLALGRIGSIASNYNYDKTGKVLAQGTGAVRAYRFFETELYAGDSWKVNRSLTFTYGLRYQLYSVPYETHGSESIQNTTFDAYFAARQKQSAAGVSGDGTVPFITYKLGGKANNADPIYSPSYKDIAPRFSFAYNPRWFQNLVINGGAGLVYDRTVINAVNFIQDQSSYLFQNNATRSYGISTSASDSLAADPRLGTNNAIPAPPAAPAISSPFTPYVSGGSPFGLAANAFNTIVDPKLKDPYSIALNFGVQQQLPADFVLKISYVGRLGRRLLAQADASQLLDFPDNTSKQLLSTAFANLTKQARAGAATATPQPWFENQIGTGFTGILYGALGSFIQNGDFADFVQALASNGLIDSNIGLASQFAGNTFVTNKGFSSYSGMLVTLNKNFSHGLKFDVNYTFSHSIDNTSKVANYIAAGTGLGFICEVQNPRVCRGNSDFDLAHDINSNFIYELPVGKGKTFAGNSSRLLDEIIGGWSISGIPRWSSGVAFTTTSNAYVAGYANNAAAIFNGDLAGVAAHAHKTADGSVNFFKDASVANADFTGPIGFTIGSRNNLRGPTNFRMDAGLAKTFPLIGENIVMKFRADAYNVLNHPVFGFPDSDITSSTFGQISATQSTPRVMQFALRLEF